MRSRHHRLRHPIGSAHLVTRAREDSQGTETVPLPCRGARGGAHRTLGTLLAVLGVLSVLSVLAISATGLALIEHASQSGRSSTAGQSSPTPATVSAFAWATAQPAIRADFPDPDVLIADGRYYAFATGTHGRHIQVARSHNLTQWAMLPDALPTLGGWVALNDPRVWAPAVLKLGDHYVLYYTAHDAASDRQCIGVATSRRPDGPFRDTQLRPLVCQTPLGGSIDPSPLQEGNQLYLYFKSDGNCCGLATHIWVQALAPDGVRLLGRPVPLLTDDQGWEGTVVEAPQMVQHDGGYYLFYSGNSYASARYAVGYARCRSPLGPCSKPRATPLLASASAHPQPGSLVGPGGADLFQVNGATWIAFHAWYVTTGGELGDSRYLLIERVEWDAGEPVVRGA